MINFDLDTKALKQYYCKTNSPFEYLKAYKEIKSFLEDNGFSHRQWSGYISEEKLSNWKVNRIVYGMSKKFTWLSKCVRKFDVTDVGENYDLVESIIAATKNVDKAKERPLVDITQNTKSKKDNTSSQIKVMSSDISSNKKGHIVKKSKGFEYGE